MRGVAPAVAEVVAGGEYCVPGGAFVYPGHTWARIDPDGQIWTGLDDFARKALKDIQRVELPAGITWTIRTDGDLLTVDFTAATGDDVAWKVCF